MNNSKKLNVKKVNTNKHNEKPRTGISKPWLITSVVLIVVLIGALMFDQLYEPRLMKIDGKKYHLKDLSYYFYIVESNYNSYNQLFGGNYWDMTYDEEAGTTLRDKAKSDAVDQSLYYEILYNEAVKNDYQLTDDEKKTAGKDADSLLSDQLSKEVIKKNHFTKSYLEKVLGKIALVTRFRQDKIDGLDIDDDGIKAGISYDDYRQYDIQYLFISTQTTDDDGKKVDLSDKDKKAAYDKISAVYDKAKTTKEWSTLIPDEEKDLQYKDTHFITSDDTTYSKELKAMMMSMKNGDISEIYEDTSGYYIIRMVDNASSESYDNEVKRAISDAEDEAFNKVYDKIKAAHTYSLNDRAIRKLRMGNLTI